VPSPSTQVSLTMPTKTTPTAIVVPHPHLHVVIGAPKSLSTCLVAENVVASCSVILLQMCTRPPWALPHLPHPEMISLCPHSTRLWMPPQHPPPCNRHPGGGLLPSSHLQHLTQIRLTRPDHSHVRFLPKSGRDSSIFISHHLRSLRAAAHLPFLFSVPTAHFSSPFCFPPSTTPRLGSAFLPPS
jgi:hypothetical protein